MLVAAKVFMKRLVQREIDDLFREVFGAYRPELKEAATRVLLDHIDAGVVSPSAASSKGLCPSFLQQATAENQHDLIDALLDRGADVTYRDRALHTVAIDAASQCNIPLLERLRRAGLPLDGRGSSGGNALHAACRVRAHQLSDPKPHAITVKWLLDAGVSPLVRNVDGHYPLHIACISGLSASIADVCPEHRRKVLLEAPSGHEGMRPLHLAAIGSWQAQAARPGELSPLVARASCEALLRLGADVAACDWRERTAAHHAAASGNGPLSMFLVESGADPNAQDLEGLTPAHLAVKGDTDGACLLAWAKVGADFHRHDLHGRSPDALLSSNRHPHARLVRAYLASCAARTSMSDELRIPSAIRPL